jgi:ribosomal protein S21
MLLLLWLSTTQEETAKRPVLFPLVASLLDNEIEKTLRQLKKILELGRAVLRSRHHRRRHHQKHVQTFSNKSYFVVFGNNFDPSAV